MLIFEALSCLKLIETKGTMGAYGLLKSNCNQSSRGWRNHMINTTITLWKLLRITWNEEPVRGVLQKHYTEWKTLQNSQEKTCAGVSILMKLRVVGAFLVVLWSFSDFEMFLKTVLVNSLYIFEEGNGNSWFS